MKFSYIFMACILLASLLSCKQKEVTPTAKKTNLAIKSATTNAKISSLNVTAQLLSNYSVSFRVTNPSVVSGRRVYYRWVFGDGVFTSTDDPSITHAYPRVRKSYTVKVYERDINTNEVLGEGSIDILVTNVQQPLNITARLLSNYQVTFRVTNADASGAANVRRKYYRWIFGDGIFTSTDAPSITHAYPRIRKSYTVKVYERDIRTNEVIREGSVNVLVKDIIDAAEAEK